MEPRSKSTFKYSSDITDHSKRIKEVAAAINNGLTMSWAEKHDRQLALYSAVTTHTSHSWAVNLLHLLIKQVDNHLAAHQTPYLEKEAVLRKYQSAQKRLFLFDYDVRPFTSSIIQCHKKYY